MTTQQLHLINGLYLIVLVVVAITNFCFTKLSSLSKLISSWRERLLSVDAADLALWRL